MTDRPFVISVDFDGTCCTANFPGLGADIGAAPVLKLLQEKGYKIICNTLRGQYYLDYDENQLEEPALEGVSKWQKRNKFKFDAINKNIVSQNWTDSPKLFADIYIDDWSLGCPLLFFGHSKAVDWVTIVSMLYDRDLISESDKVILTSKVKDEISKNYENYVKL